MMTEEKNNKQEDIPGEWSDHFDKSIRGESTRAKVVLSACYLDELLNQVLQLLLKPIDSKNDPLFDGPQAPLGSFSAKIDLAARMGVISKDTKRSLHLVRKIRNRFAHSLNTCAFDDPKTLAWNTELHKLNDHATEERRATFSEGIVGDYEKSVSWLIYWLKHIAQQIPTSCPHCGSEMEYRANIKGLKPNEHS